MSCCKRLETLILMKEICVIPVFCHADSEVAGNIICTRADGGAMVVEFTNRGNRAINVFTQIEEYCVLNS